MTGFKPGLSVEGLCNNHCPPLCFILFHCAVKMGHSRPLFLYFLLFNKLTIIVQYKYLPMTGFEPRISGSEATAQPT